MTTWDVQFGTYRCIGCGETMLSLVETDADGRIVYRETPLGCPWCDDDLVVVEIRLPRALPREAWKSRKFSGEEVQALYDAYDAGKSPYIEGFYLIDWLITKAFFMLKSWKGEKIKKY
jgi:hypothetical protein